MDKKQELIKRITKMLEPYEKIGGYSFTVNLYIKNDEKFIPCDTIRISYNDNYSIAPNSCFTV